MSRIINKECIYCNKVIKYDTYWCKHLLTKRHLKNVEKYNNNTITTQEQHKNNTRTTQEQHNNNTITTQEHPQEHQVNIQITSIENQKKIYGHCKYCNKSFSKQQSLSRHQLKYCNIKKNIENNNKMKQIINHTTNNNNTTNNTMNINNKNIINVNYYGSEDYSLLDKKFLYKLSLYGNDVKKKIISTLDKLYIENNTNHNVVVSNIDGNYCKVYNEDDKWELEKLDKVLDYRMYNSVLNIIRSVSKNSNDLESVIINKTMNNINKYQKYIEENKELDIDKKDKRDFEYIREDHKIKLYNLNY